MARRLEAPLVEIQLSVMMSPSRTTRGHRRGTHLEQTLAMQTATNKDDNVNNAGDGDAAEDDDDDDDDNDSDDDDGDEDDE